MLEFLQHLPQSWEGLHKRVLQRSPQQKFIVARSVDRGPHAIRPRHPMPLPGCDTFSHCRTYSHSLLMSRRAATTRSTSQLEAHLQAAPVAEVSAISRHNWAVSLSGSRQGSMRVSPTNPVQTLMLKQISYPCSRIAWELFSVQGDFRRR
jgi:hypothetical protein